MKVFLTLGTAPFVLVLLIGAGMSHTETAPASPAPIPYPRSVPGPPAPFTGHSAGCTQPDPTGTGGCVTQAVSWLLTEVGLAFGPLPTSCWDAHAWNPTSDHPRGRACDFTFGGPGTFPGHADVERGWLLATWLRVNAEALRVRYLIWQGRTWSAGRSDDGWRPYTGGGVYDPTDPTGGHYDNVHVSTTN